MGYKQQKKKRGVPDVQNPSESKPVSTARGLGMMFILMFVVFAPILGYTYHKNMTAMEEARSAQQQRQAEEEALQMPRAIEALGPAFMRRRAPTDTYWLIGNESQEVFVAKVDAFESHAKTLLASAADVSPLAREIVKRQGNFTITMFKNGSTQTSFALKPGETIEDALERKMSGPEMVIVPKMEMEKYVNQFPSELYYRQDWRALSVVGIEIPDTWLAALLLHEMGHQLRHAQGARSATAPNTSDIFISEEMEMHELEHQVLVARTGGKLTELYENIRMRADDPQSPDSVVLAVTQHDMIAFEQLTDIESCGPKMGSIYAAQFFVGLAIHTVNQSGGSMEDKILVYRKQTGMSRAKRHAPLQEHASL